jgi:hypothetical protein
MKNMPRPVPATEQVIELSVAFAQGALFNLTATTVTTAANVHKGVARACCFTDNHKIVLRELV